MNRTLRIYQTVDGSAPFEEWLQDLRDVQGRARIRTRIDRAIHGNLGTHRILSGGLAELKLDFGPGYRLYVGLQGAEIIVLLCGGDKDSQTRDISDAMRYWDDYRRRL